MNIIIVLAHDRPEMLDICLDRLSQCDGIDDKSVWVYEDCERRDLSVGQEVCDVISRSSLKFKDFRHAEMHGSKQVWDNVFTAAEDACNAEADFVYMIEDDTIVTKDFIRWNEAAHDQFRPFVACSSQLILSGSDPLAVSISNSDYCSYAISMTRENLERILLVSEAPTAHFEEYMHNFLIKHKELAVFPILSRAHNIGWYGTNRPETSDRSIERTRAELDKMPTVPDWSERLYVSEDRRNRWFKAYTDQARWGFKV